MRTHAVRVPVTNRWGSVVSAIQCIIISVLSAAAVDERPITVRAVLGVRLGPSSVLRPVFHSGAISMKPTSQVLVIDDDPEVRKLISADQYTYINREPPPDG